jgi:hypothetical protein
MVHVEECGTLGYRILPRCPFPRQRRASPGPHVDLTMKPASTTTLRPLLPGGATACDGPRFEYATLPLADASALRLTADRIRDRMNATRRDTLAIGRELLGIKDRLPHGAFGARVRAELGMTPRMAQHCMSDARMLQRFLESIRRTASLVPSATLYRLMAASALAGGDASRHQGHVPAAGPRPATPGRSRRRAARSVVGDQGEARPHRGQWREDRFEAPGRPRATKHRRLTKGLETTHSDERITKRRRARPRVVSWPRVLP